MATFARGVNSLFRPQFNPNICRQCRRSFLLTTPLQSGHNKWSKIKHDKAANDAKKTLARTQHSNALALYSKLYGSNPTQNPQLAAAIIAAKRAGVPKDKIEKAIARGQGRSSEGAALESMTVEAMRPPSIALVVDIETDNKLRVLQDVKVILKQGKTAQSASKFFFTRVGRVVFEKSEGIIDVDTIMDDAIEAGAEDLETSDDGNIVIWTQPTATTQMCHTIGDKYGLKVLNSSIVWSANKDTEVKVDSEPWLPDFIDMLEALREYPDVQAVYANISRGAMSDEEWTRIAQSLDA